MRLCLVIIVALIIGCNQNKNPNTSLFSGEKEELDSSNFSHLEIGLQTINVYGKAVDIIVPYGPVKGDILVLPGWNFSKDRWCSDSDLCTKALAKGYRLILPEMGFSVYSSPYYPQSRQDWISAPTGLWLTDTLIHYIRHYYGILNVNKRNFILGLSTGGRGVALTCIRTNDLFKAGAALSGDFDQVQTPFDNVMAGFYGTYEENKKLWEMVDNPTHDAASLHVPLYLGHGLYDPVVPSQQTISFYEKLKKVNPNLKVSLHISETGLHDFKYWNSEVDSVLNFFENH